MTCPSLKPGKLIANFRIGNLCHKQAMQKDTECPDKPFERKTFLSKK